MSALKRQGGALGRKGGELCGGFCRLALMALASLFRAVAGPASAAAGWCERKARGMQR